MQILKSGTKHALYYFLMASICLTVIARNVIGLPLPLISFLVLGVMLCAFCSREEILAFLCSMAPFEMTFQYRYMLIIGIIFLLYKSKRFRFILMLPIILMMVWELLHFIENPISATSYMREFVSLIALGVVLIVEQIDYKDGLPVRSLALMTLFSCMVTVASNLRLGYSMVSGDRLGSTYEQAESFNGLLNPNVGSFLCVLSICGLAMLLMHEGKKSFDIIVIIGLSLFVILFQSKAAIISLAFAIVIYMYSNSNNAISPTLKIVGTGILAIIFGLLFFRGAIIGLLMRFSAADFSTGRVSVWEFYHKYLMSDISNILFGTGLHDYPITIAGMYPAGVLASSGAVTYINHHMVLIMSHNSIQEILIVWGILGLLLVGWLIINILRHDKSKHPFVNYLAFCFVLLYTLQGQLISSSVVLIGLLFSMVCIEYD